MMIRTRQAFRQMLVDLRAMFLVGLLFVLTALFGCGDDSGKVTSDLKPLYGPPPNDAGIDGKPLDGLKALDGQRGKDAVGVDGPCQPATLYGPKPCASDSECATQYGAGWYCDLKNPVDDGCGHKSIWPVCKTAATKDAGVSKDGCMPVALYGPKPCLSDSECVTLKGAGWYCDQNNPVNDGCGHQSTWPVCKSGVVADAGPVKLDGCMPAALYGPKPCADDAECATQYGAGWYCDKDNPVNDGCGHVSTWPVCKK
jgi:hypothetical protein